MNDATMKIQTKEDVKTNNNAPTSNRLDSVLECEERYLIDVLRAFWNDREPPRPPEGFGEKRFLELVNFQRVAATVADELDKRPEWFSEGFKKTMTRARAMEVLRDVAYRTTSAKVETLFEENGIRYLPLKGAVMKGLYPQTYQRPARDYDVLVEESEILRAEDLLMRKYGYKEQGVCLHHYSLKNDKGMMEVEVHRFLLGRGDVPIFDELWSRALPDPDETLGKKLRFKLTNEDFYLHMVVHLAKHWRNNGASIRSVVDIWVFNQKLGDSFDLASLDEPLRKLGILEFTRNVERASRVWFGDLESDEIIDAMACQFFNPNRFGPPIRPTKPKNRIRRFIDKALGMEIFQERYLEDRQRSFVGRIWWRIVVWSKFTMERLKDKGIYARAWRSLFRREDQGNPTERKNFERLVGFEDVPRGESQDDAKRRASQEPKR